MAPAEGLPQNNTPQGKGRLSIAYTGAYTPHTSGLVRADGHRVNWPLARGDNTIHNAALRYTSASGLDLSADYTHYSSWQLAAMQNRYADGSRTAFDVVSGQSVDRVNVAPTSRTTLGNGWGMTYGRHLQLGGRPRLPALQAPTRATSPPSIPIRTSTEYTATSMPG